MLKTRLIPCLLLQNGQLVRSEEFSFHQVVGNPITQVDRFAAWACDELIYIDITREARQDLRQDHKVRVDRDILAMIREISRSCFMPLTFGGGIRDVEGVRLRLLHGADKVTINTRAVEDPEFITECASRFGSQAIIVSIDARCHGPGEWEVFTGWGKHATGLDPAEWAREAERRGAGEIFLNSIDRDGMGNGYDVELIRRVCDATGIPVIACGGVGRFKHLVAGVEAGASAVSAANIFHFTEHSTQTAKKALLDAGVDVRRAGVGIEA